VPDVRRACVGVVGSLNADYRVSVAHIPVPGETVAGSEVVVAAGGKGANQAVAASRAGATSRIIGAIGDDRDGDVIRRTLTADDIDTRHVHTVAGAQTGRAFITVDASGENAIIVSAGANGLLIRDAVTAGLDGLSAGDLVLLQLESPEHLVRHAARIGAARGCTVVLNAAPAPTSVHGLFDDIDLLVVNEHELASIANLLSDMPSDSRNRLVDMTLVADASQATVICTAGSGGAFVAQQGRIEHIAADPVQPVDTTAAGDTFIGYVAAALAADPDSVTEAVETAVRAAGIAVTRSGAIDAIPHRNEVVAAVATTKGQS
jgi:ribokinase